MSGQSEIIEWYYITDADYKKITDTGAWSTSVTNPFDVNDFKTFPSLPGYHFARITDIDDEEHDWADMHDIVLASTAFAESNQSGVIL